MFRFILITFSCFLCFVDIHSSEIDTFIYHELCSFLISENKILAKDTIGTDSFSLLYISDILEDNKANLEDSLGVYVFNKIGIQDDINYILIKSNNSYAVFKENDPLSIFIYLFTIKEKYPLILNSELCNEYIEKLMKVNRHPIIGIPKGKLLFYSALK